MTAWMVNVASTVAAATSMTLQRSPSWKHDMSNDVVFRPKPFAFSIWFLLFVMGLTHTSSSNVYSDMFYALAMLWSAAWPLVVPKTQLLATTVVVVAFVCAVVGMLLADCDTDCVGVSLLAGWLAMASLLSLTTIVGDPLNRFSTFVSAGCTICLLGIASRRPWFILPLAWTCLCLEEAKPPSSLFLLYVLIALSIVLASE